MSVLLNVNPLNIKIEDIFLGKKKKEWIMLHSFITKLITIQPLNFPKSWPTHKSDIG